MRKATEALWNEAVNQELARGGYLPQIIETFRRLAIENERECAEPVAEVRYKQDGYTFVAFNGFDVPVGTKLFTFPPASQVPEGWRLVPIEPTYEMLVAMSGEWHSSRHKPDVYKAMLAAAPEVK